MCECGSEQVALEDGFGAWEDVGWCGWVLGCLRWPFGGFSHTRTSKESLQEDTGNLQEENRETTRGLQEDAKSSFHCFEGVTVGEKCG